MTQLDTDGPSVVDLEPIFRALEAFHMHTLRKLDINLDNVPVNCDGDHEFVKLPSFDDFDKLEELCLTDGLRPLDFNPVGV